MLHAACAGPISVSSLMHHWIGQPHGSAMAFGQIGQYFAAARR